MPKVSWNISYQNTQDKETSRCSCCGHRNIKPHIRELFKCKKCDKTFCIHCMCAGNLCIDCK